MTANLEPALRWIVELVVRSCDPDEVVLFGSHAKGLAGRHSDVDILVVGTFHSPRWLRTRELETLLAQLPLRFDLHMVTRDELAAESRKPRCFLNTLQSNCITLYRKPFSEGPRNEVAVG